MRYLNDENRKYATRWIRSHAEEVRCALLEAGVETAIIIPEGLQNRPPSAFGYCAKLLIGTDLSYRAIWSLCRRAGWPNFKINALKTYASRLRVWYGVAIPDRTPGRTHPPDGYARWRE